MGYESIPNKTAVYEYNDVARVAEGLWRNTTETVATQPAAAQLEGHQATANLAEHLLDALVDSPGRHVICEKPACVLEPEVH